MKILALDATQDYCSVALAVDGALCWREQHAPRGHAERILPQVEAVLAEAGLALGRLDALAFGRGPGSFTGLRIAAGVAQGLALGADLAVAPVSSLAAMAQGYYREAGGAGRVCAAFDARLDEVYWGCYVATRGVMRPVTAEAVSPAADLSLPAGRWAAVGPGWAAYPEMRRRLERRLSAVRADTAPLARDIIPLAMSIVAARQTVGAQHAVPVYLRHKVARTLRERAAK